MHNYLLEVDGLDEKWTCGLSSAYEKEAGRLSMDELRQAYGAAYGASVGTHTTTDIENTGMGHSTAGSYAWSNMSSTLRQQQPFLVERHRP
jgi:hypothetical protein